MFLESEFNMKKSNALALIPIGVFVVFYLSLGVVFEYIMKIPTGFYNVRNDSISDNFKSFLSFDSSFKFAFIYICYS